MADFGRFFSFFKTPQAEHARRGQKPNHAGGFSFELDKWGRLDRFLVLGSEGGTYYVSERQLTVDNAKSVLVCLEEDGQRAVKRIVELSVSGRAPKNDPAIFALAMAAGAESPVVRKAALLALPKVCRTGTHLFHFARDVEHFRRWGRGLRSAVANWYVKKSPDELAYQVVKYGQRDGWSHRDLLRLSHASALADSPGHRALFRWVACEGELGERLVVRKKAGVPVREDRYEAVPADALPPIVSAFERLKRAKDVREVVSLVREHRLTHEMVPSEWKNSPEVWAALLEDMPLGAMLRSLAKMTQVGLLAPMGAASLRVAEALSNPGALRAARIHPIGVLVAQKTYAQGHGEKGKLSWTPVPQITDALNEAFYLSFRAIEPTGKNHLLALDVSGSMTSGGVAGVSSLSPRVASAAMAMATARSEKRYHVMAFCDRLVPLSISASERLDDVVRKTDGLPFGGTDCALPMIWATENKVPVDAFVVYTDSETWAGKVHPFQALCEYRQKMGRPAKLVVVGMTATQFTIADPSDAGMLDVVGFDAAAPAVIADFVRQ